MKKKIGIIVLITGFGYLCYELIRSLMNTKTVGTVSPTTTASTSLPVNSTVTNVLYPSISNVPPTYVNLTSGGTTSHTIPAGTIQYAWRIVSGTAIINGTTYDEGIFDDQSYEPGVTYGAITITSVTGQVIITYKKPV